MKTQGKTYISIQEYLLDIGFFLREDSFYRKINDTQSEEIPLEAIAGKSIVYFQEKYLPLFSEKELYYLEKAQSVNQPSRANDKVIVNTRRPVRLAVEQIVQSFSGSFVANLRRNIKLGEVQSCSSMGDNLSLNYCNDFAILCMFIADRITADQDMASDMRKEYADAIFHQHCPEFTMEMK